MGESSPASGPDFSSGIALSECPQEGTIAGRVGETAILLSRIGGDFFAVSATCTHYGGALADGLIGKSDVRCPLHHACFDLKTGAVLRAPALDPLDCWRVEVEGDQLFVREKLPSLPIDARPQGEVHRILIIGGGAAGIACAIELRKLGFNGTLTILSEDLDPPYDRPNLSKDYLAGTALEEWMPLRSDDWYATNQVELRLGTKVDALDIDKFEVTLNSGERLGFDRLLLATGSKARRLEHDGFLGRNVFTLRSFADARAIIDCAEPNSKAVILGSSFIALEAAAALRKRNVDVTIIAPEKTPFERLLGSELGEALRKLHEDQGIKFHLESTGSRFENHEVILASGQRIPADFVLVGVGVIPRTELAEKAGLTVNNGVWVDEQMETSCRGVFAAGDIAAYPDPLSKDRVRIEHWTVAERQGQLAAANMLGAMKRFDSAPFFWTEQHGVTIRYVGHARSWDEVRSDGPVDTNSCVLRYYREGKHLASATINHDKTSLQEGLELEASQKN